ncbi:MAG: Na/Pi symporter [Actinomycetota bacterium]|nr:Na/Pi symporter [Actinomycetota bacterium]
MDPTDLPIVGQQKRPLPAPIRALLVVTLLYLFLVGVKLLEGGIKGLGSDFTDSLFQGVSNPVAGLLVGVLATVLVQSSSVTTSTIVGLVGTGIVSVEHAVPMIMGANIGTTVTNTIVSLAHMRESEEFRRAFTAATMHDFFNIMVVAILLPLEVITGVLSTTARNITEAIAGDIGGGKFNSPIKGAVKWGAQQVESIFGWVNNEKVAAVIFLIAGIALIFITLMFITRNMRVLVAARIERSLNAALAKSGTVGIVVGMLVTIAVQSSSITTSILIPLVASGILLVRNAYPITLGANIGTTVTALIAALGIGEIDGLTIAVTHTVFNTAGILLIYPWSKIRYIPVTLAGKLADVALRRKSLALGYTFFMFVVVPVVGILVLR